MNKLLLFSILLTVMMSILCTNDLVNEVGGTGCRSAISGTLQFPDGSPASHVAVCIRNRGMVAEIPHNGAAKKSGVADSVVTDKNGTFTFSEYPEAGTYVVEAKKTGNGVLIDSVTVGSDSTPVILMPATLQPVGAISGSVQLVNGAVTGNVYLLIFGLDRFTEVNDDGTFLFPDLAPGNYDLRFICTGDGFDKFDTANVEVTASDTTMIDSIVLPYSGIPVPQHLRARYDTLRQTVTLTWSKLDTSLVKGYSIYRRNLDSIKVFSAPINREVVVDTFFADSTCWQDNTYEYRVAAIGKTSTRGLKSDSVHATIVSYLICAIERVLPYGEAAGAFGSISDVDISASDALYLLDEQSGLIQIYDTVLQNVKSIPLCIGSLSGLQMAVGTNGNIFINYCHYDQITAPYIATIYRQNEEGTVLSYFSQPCQWSAVIEAAADMLYIATDTSVVRYTYDGLYISSSQPHDSVFLNKIHLVGADMVACFDWIQSKIIMCGRNGDQVGELRIPLRGAIEDFAIDEQRKRIYIISRSDGYYRDRTYSDAMLYVFDLDGNEIATYRMMNTGRAWVNLDSNNNIYITGSNRIVKLKPLSR